ncbi:hypothetical protein JJV70_06920 [Streptomyces sp. JJ66]|uniref:DUF5719 family protein n=1 Tax=Streptomyces sp. JJ66 TaxID=2803843 RepID=UPI001C5C798C|nr:DUF5719 family protein [Streptomyces sp. JJ66]MBW1601844.1 hypothetical protein [Streptomyces sp. JJ66]
MSLTRPALALAAVVTALAAVTGVAAVTTPAGQSAPQATEAERRPVQRATLVCPQPPTSDLGTTEYTAHTPPSDGTGDEGSAGLLPASSTLDNGGQDKRPEDAERQVALKQPGTPVTYPAEGQLTALTGTATGALAPGWTVQQTTTVTGGDGRGLYGARCTAPDTGFWFAGASTAEERHDSVHLTNPDDTSATVDLQLYGPDGRVETESGSGINIPAHSTVPVLLSTLTPEPVTDATLHVAVRTGRVGAQVQALDEKLGGDWIAPAARASERIVIPGIPADATGVRLTAFAPGEEDAELAVRLAGPDSSFTPAGQETLHVKSGMTTAVDLGDLTRGEPASLVLTPVRDSADGPVIAAVRVLRGENASDGEDGDGASDGGDGADSGKGARELAFIPATPPVERRTTATGSPAAPKGGEGSTLYLTAPGEAAEVRVTASPGSEGGEAVSKAYTLKKGTTTAVDDLLPDAGQGRYALTVEKVSGGPVHAARMLERVEDDVPMFTVQALTDDGGTVTVPPAVQDLSLLTE